MRPYYALAVLPFLTGCGSEPAHKTVSAPVTPMRVETVAAAEADCPSTYEATGTVRARAMAQRRLGRGRSAQGLEPRRAEGEADGAEVACGAGVGCCLRPCPSGS